MSVVLRWAIVALTVGTSLRWVLIDHSALFTTTAANVTSEQRKAEAHHQGLKRSLHRTSHTSEYRR